MRPCLGRRLHLLLLEAELHAARGGGLDAGAGVDAVGVRDRASEADELPGVDLVAHDVVGLGGVAGAGVDVLVHLLGAGVAVGAGLDRRGLVLDGLGHVGLGLVGEGLVVALGLDLQLAVLDADEGGAAIGVGHLDLAVVGLGQPRDLAVDLADLDEALGRVVLGVGLGQDAGLGGVHLAAALAGDDRVLAAGHLVERDAGGEALADVVEREGDGGAVGLDVAGAVGDGHVGRHAGHGVVVGAEDGALVGVDDQRQHGLGELHAVLDGELRVLDEEGAGAVEQEHVVDAGLVAVAVDVDLHAGLAVLERDLRVDPGELDAAAGLVVADAGEARGRDGLGAVVGVELGEHGGGGEGQEGDHDALVGGGLETVHGEPPVGMPMKQCTGTLSNVNPERLVFHLSVITERHIVLTVCQRNLG